MFFVRAAYFDNGQIRSVVNADIPINYVFDMSVFVADGIFEVAENSQPDKRREVRLVARQIGFAVLFLILRGAFVAGKFEVYVLVSNVAYFRVVRATYMQKIKVCADNFATAITDIRDFIRFRRLSRRRNRRKCG